MAQLMFICYASNMATNWLFNIGLNLRYILSYLKNHAKVEANLTLIKNGAIYVVLIIWVFMHQDHHDELILAIYYFCNFFDTPVNF